MGLWDATVRSLPASCVVIKWHGEVKGCEWPTVERVSRVAGCCVVCIVVFPSSTGLVKSCVNLPRPLGKPEYFLVTDSA